MCVCVCNVYVVIVIEPFLSTNFFSKYPTDRYKTSNVPYLPAGGFLKRSFDERIVELYVFRPREVSRFFSHWIYLSLFDWLCATVVAHEIDHHTFWSNCTRTLAHTYTYKHLSRHCDNCCIATLHEIASHERAYFYVSIERRILFNAIGFFSHSFVFFLSLSLCLCLRCSCVARNAKYLQ